MSEVFFRQNHIKFLEKSIKMVRKQLLKNLEDPLY